jgi:hypothetical protein
MLSISHLSHLERFSYAKNRRLTRGGKSVRGSNNKSGKSDTCADRSRAMLTTLIQAFLNSEITAFQFDERLDQFRDLDDPVIRHVVDAVWYHYDDCDDHFVCLSKQEWDYFQRLLLALNSDCRIEIKIDRRWSLKQLLAAISLCGFGYFAFQAGWGHHLLMVGIPFGIVSIALSFWQPNDQADVDIFQPIFPFASFADLSATYYSSTFRKTRYPNHISGRRIRSPLMTAFWWGHLYTMWLILSPFPLLVQVLPETRKHTHIKAANQPFRRSRWPREF